VRVPVFLYWADRDSTVPVGLSQSIIANALIAGGNTDLKLRVYPGGATHSLALPTETW
jgi:hypothetical protein